MTEICVRIYYRSLDGGCVPMDVTLYEIDGGVYYATDWVCDTDDADAEAAVLADTETLGVEAMTSRVSSQVAAHRHTSYR